MGEEVICRRCDDPITEETVEEGMHNWCLLLEQKDAEEKRADDWARVAERLAFHLSDCLYVMKQKAKRGGYGPPMSHGDDGTKALEDFRAMLPPWIKMPRDYERITTLVPRDAERLRF